MSRTFERRSIAIVCSLSVLGVLWGASKVSSQDAHIVDAVEQAALKAKIITKPDRVIATLLAKPVNLNSPEEALQRLLHMASVFPLKPDATGPQNMSLTQVCSFWSEINEDPAFKRSPEWQAFRKIYDPVVKSLLYGSGSTCGNGLIKKLQIEELKTNTTITQLDGSTVTLPAKSRRVKLELTQTPVIFNFAFPERKCILSPVGTPPTLTFYVNTDVGYALKSKSNYLAPPIKNVQWPMVPDQTDAKHFRSLSDASREKIRSKMDAWEDTVANSQVASASPKMAKEYLKLKDELGREAGDRILRKAADVTSAFNLFMAKGDGSLEVQNSGDPQAGTFGGLSVMQTSADDVLLIGKGFAHAFGKDFNFYRAQGGAPRLDSAPAPASKIPAKGK